MLMVEEKIYICVNNENPNFKINEIYTICKYTYNEKILYRIFDKNNFWRHSFDENSPFQIRLSESFITLAELRKQKLKFINESNL